MNKIANRLFRPAKVLINSLQPIADDDRLICPTCNAHEWIIRNYSNIQCCVCYSKFVNLGSLGLQQTN